MIRVGLTGGIGSGKSTVANFFIALGIPVYFADIEAKKLMAESVIIKTNIIAEFGKKAFIGERLNTTYLASIVFQNHKKLEKLNTIVHPEVAKHFSKWAEQQHSAYVIQENAIIFESRMASKFHYIVAVDAPKDDRIARVIERDQATKEEVLARMNNQWDSHKRNLKSDFVIDNLNMDETKKEVERVHKEILEDIKKKSNTFKKDTFES